jgi:hypothetical protein
VIPGRVTVDSLVELEQNDDGQTCSGGMMTMNDALALTAAARAQFEALRARWEQAKASGTVDAFARELFEQSEVIPAPADRVYESEAEQAAYERARATMPVTSADVLALLPLYFGDETGIPMEHVLAELEATEIDVGSAGA